MEAVHLLIMVIFMLMGALELRGSAKYQGTGNLVILII